MHRGGVYRSIRSKTDIGFILPLIIFDRNERFARILRFSRIDRQILFKIGSYNYETILMSNLKAAIGLCIVFVYCIVYISYTGDQIVGAYPNRRSLLLFSLGLLNNCFAQFFIRYLDV